MVAGSSVVVDGRRRALPWPAMCCIFYFFILFAVRFRPWRTAKRDDCRAF
jgi:hypothetical protein